MLAQALLVAAAASAVVAQDDFVPLAAKRFEWTNLPYQADTSDGERGRQAGYNRCNATTAGEDSLCQTAVINSLDDFCLWAPPVPGDVVGNIEGEMVAWCTRGEQYGARTIPAGALTGVQFIRTPHYVQVTGRIDQTLINIGADDDGGEMDPHGADQRGNPLGGLLFSNSFGPAVTNGTSSSGVAFQQVVQWHNFMGANLFCLKACDPSWEDGWRMCEHIYDRIGCNANAPAAYEDGVFESCLGDDQLPPGIYVGENGATSTYSQPGEGVVISTLPYVPAIPSTSSCTPYESAAIYNQPGGAAGITTTSAASSASTSSASSTSMNSTSSGLSSASASANSTTSALSSASASNSSSTATSTLSSASSAVSSLSSAISSRTDAGGNLVASSTSDGAASATSAPASGAGQLVPIGRLLALMGFVAIV
ncbi:hypothetical protein BCR35DRAFT_349035 [Leucosporidium creatinivorum]|uniref:Macrofage activating glycoprotein n=1 Tax=Leucosporidium creatinivorum TaxID=106004 RepID=A0A1Y2G5A9_9BASI|nr:hypothetical protein BCR35DRAFT_349035 [Leucosporidium creatinivorum]